MNGWREALLEDLVDIYDSKRVPLSASQRSERKGPYPYYGAQSVIDHIDDYIFDGRYILVPEDGENLRSRKLPIAYFADGRFWVNNHAHIIKGKPGIANDRFVQGALESLDIGAFVTGAAQPKLSQAALRRIPVQVPCFEEQVAIGLVLESMDALIENNRRRIGLLEQMAQAIYREWFVKFRYPGHEQATFVESPLGPIPSDWRPVASGYLISEALLEIGDGYRAKNSELTGGPGDLPFARVANIGDGEISFDGCDFLPLEVKTSLRGKVARPGDSVISMKGTVGRSALVPKLSTPFVFSPQVSYWRSLDHSIVPPEFLYAWIRSDDFKVQCSRVKGATAMADYVNLKDQRQMLLVLPSAVTLAGFVSKVAPLLESGSIFRSKTKVLTQLRDMLLPKLVTGQIDVSSLDLDVLMDGMA
jgi:type I restriction enzyme, S subunit